MVARKFDELQRANPLRVVISAFNELCAIIKKTSSDEELGAMYQQLTYSFGTSFSRVVQVLPNIVLLGLPHQTSMVSFERDDEIRSNSLTFILQTLIRVISSKEHPVLMFLDDLQWSDARTCRVIADVLSDTKGSSCMLFVGAYRSNEVDAGHPLFEFVDKLKQGNVPLKKLHLNGMDRQELHLMISDALKVMPRHCQDIAQTLYQKTNGSTLLTNGK